MKGVIVMFDNVGKKIKNLAETICVLGIAASVLLSLPFCKTNLFVGIVIAVVGCIASWAGSMCLYGFGELIEKTTLNCETNDEILQILASKYGNPPELNVDEENVTEQDSIKHYS